MRVKQLSIDTTAPTAGELDEIAAIAPQLILVFGSVAQIGAAGLGAALASACPGALVAGCSTAGEISGDGVTDAQAVLTAVHFDACQVVMATTDVADIPDSSAAGARLAAQLGAPGIGNVLLFGPGVNVNGSALIAGLHQHLGPTVRISGGLAGDGGAFKETLTLAGDKVGSRTVVAIGFIGDKLSAQHGSFHGWVPFGPARRVTRSEGNLLFELDGEPALEIYKRYLGDYAKDLPASGLLFPFEMLGENQDKVGLIRTILGIDEDKGMLVLAGDIIENGYLRLMHASTDSLVDGAEEAASRAREGSTGSGDKLAVLVSCVGRKLVMGVRVDEEVEAVADIFGRDATLAGFYSYGEISPELDGIDCKLHNQTMTITYLSEAA